MVAAISFFKGYYFKCSTEEETIAFIPAIHGRGKERNASLQIITEQGAYHIPLYNMVFHKKKVKVKAGKNFFSLKGIRLEITTEGLEISGTIRFSGRKEIKSSIMGPFRYLPLMQCRHEIYSMAHEINGNIKINGKEYLFENGWGYIEGDKGRSFPKEYAWTQCKHGNISLMLAVADIPLPGSHFTGVIGAIWIDGAECRLATYRGARATYIGNRTIVIKQGQYCFMVNLPPENERILLAPQKGKMDRTIRESVRCTVRYRLERGDTVVFDFRSDMASMEYEYNC